MRNHLLLLATAAFLTAAAPADPLPRSTVFGVSGTPQPAGDVRGVHVDSLAPGLTGEKLGLKVGDIVLDVNGTPIGDMAAFAGVGSKLEAGKPVRMTVLRGGQKQTLTASAVGRPHVVY